MNATYILYGEPKAVFNLKSPDSNVKAVTSLSNRTSHDSNVKAVMSPSNVLFSYLIIIRNTF